MKCNIKNITKKANITNYDKNYNEKANASKMIKIIKYSKKPTL